MTTVNKIVCPVCKGNKVECVACKGSGQIVAPQRKTKNWIYDKDGEMRKAAVKLRDRGYTLREIAEILGYNHPQSVQNLLQKKIEV